MFSSKAQRGFILAEIVILGLGLCLCLCTFKALRRADTTLATEQVRLQEVLYMPKLSAVKFLSFGYANALSNLLWFNTINYFGKHYASDRNYEWLYHMCDLVTALDPRKRAVYEFCATMLAWEANTADRSVALLSRAIETFPEDWHLYYMRGFTYMYFQNDPVRAQQDFAHGATLPKTDKIMARLAAKKLVDLGDPQTALTFLEDMIRRAQSQAEKDALLERWKETRYELDFINIEQALEIFRSQKGVAPRELKELISAGIINALPNDPFGGYYFLDQAGQVQSSSKHKRLSQRIKKTFIPEEHGIK